MDASTPHDQDRLIRWAARPEDFAYLEKASSHARISDPGTSHIAASRISDKRGLHHFNIWATLSIMGPLTSEELIEALGPKATSPSGTRTRIRRLEVEGWIQYTGSHGLTQAGNKARKMRAVIPGWKQKELF